MKNNQGGLVELLVGRVGKAHGLRGEVTIDVRTDSPELRFVPEAQLTARRGREETTLTLETCRWHSGRLLVRFVEFPDRTAADAGRGYELYVLAPVGELPEDPDEFYDHQLIGLEVFDQANVRHGVVSSLTHGAQDLLHVTTAQGEVLVPFVAALVPEVDLPGGRLTVADRPGLLTPAQD